MAGELSLTRSYGDVLTLTGDAVRPIISDVITSRIPTFLVFNQGFGVKETLGGGEEIHYPVAKELSQAQSYTDLGTLTTQRPTSLTRVRGVWKQQAADIVVSGLDMIKNGGDQAIANLFVFRSEMAFLSLAERLGGSVAGIFSTGTESTLLQLAGLQSWVSTTTSSGTIGGLSRTNAFWQNVALDISSAFGTNGLNQMRSMALRLGRGIDRPNLIVFNRATFENFHRAHQATLNYNLPQAPSVAHQAVMDLGVPTISWNNMAVIYDDFVPVNIGYMLMLRYFHLVVHKEQDFELGEFIAPSDQHGLFAHVFWAGELICDSIRNQGVLQNGDTN